MDAPRTPRLGKVQPTLSSRFAAPWASLADRTFREPRSRQGLGLSAGSSGARRHWLLIVLLATLVALAPAVAGATQRIRAEEAAVRAVNTLRPDGDRLVLRQPHDRVEFAAEGVRFEPRRGPAWSWSLRAVEVGGTALPGVRLAGVGPRADGLTARYERGALVEEYVAHADGIEQRFVLGAPPAAAGALVLVGEVASAGSFETLARGWRWRNDRGAVRLGEVFAYDATGAALPATLEVTATGTRIVLDGAALAAARYPVTVDPEIGANDFRISDMGGTGDANYDAFEPAVAYNATDNEYLVVWAGDDDVGGLVDGEYEIFGQRLDATTGAEVGSNDFRISDMGGTGDVTYGRPLGDRRGLQRHRQRIPGGLEGRRQRRRARERRVPRSSASGSTPPPVPRWAATTSASATWGAPATRTTTSILSPWPTTPPTTSTWWSGWATTTSAGWWTTSTRSSASGSTPPPAPRWAATTSASATWGAPATRTTRPRMPRWPTTPVDNEYLVVWKGDDNVGGLVDDEYEIFGQRLNAATGTALGSERLPHQRHGGHR